MIKTRTRSIADIKSGSHVVLKEVHYLVKSVDLQNNTFSAYSLCEQKQIKLYEHIKWETVDILKCSEHSVNVDEALKQVEDEMNKPSKRKWGSSDCLVTAMLCGEEHSIRKRYTVAHDAAPSGYTRIIPIVNIIISRGDHLVFKDFSNKLRSVVVLKYISDTRVIVTPPLPEGEIIDLTTHPEVYRVDYCTCLQGAKKLKCGLFAHKTAKIRVNSPFVHNNYCTCLPADEVIKRVNNNKNNIHDNSSLITWAKIGREVSIDSEVDVLHKFSYVEIKSTDEIKPGHHLVEYFQGKRRHVLITEKESGQSAFKVILCQHNVIKELSQPFDLTSGKKLYRIEYNGLESMTRLEHEEVPDSIRKARSCLNRQLHNPWAQMLFITWAKIGTEELKASSPLSFYQLLCKWFKVITEESFEVNPQPVSRSRIVSFKQLTPGDYLLVKPLVGYSHHYLVSSVHSPLVCSAIEYSDNGTVTSNELTLSQPGKYPLYYLINYEPQVCFSNAIVLEECQRLINNTLSDRVDSQNFAHYLKTKTELEVNVADLPILCETQPSDSPKMMSQFIEAVISLDSLACSDHIIFRSSKPPFRPTYQSALVLCTPQNGKIEIATMTCDGIVKITCGFNDLPYLHRVVYQSYHSSEEEVVRRVNEFIGNQEQHRYHEHYNNSHHFVTHCKCDLENPLTGILKELELQDQGR